MTIKAQGDCILQVQVSRQMEAANSFFDCSPQFISHNSLRAVLGQFQIVDTCHDTGKVVVCRERCLMRFSHYGQRRIEASETYESISCLHAKHARIALTTNGQFWTTCYKLKIITSGLRIKTSHHVDQITDSTAFNIESMVSFQRFTQRYDKLELDGICDEE